MAEQTALTGDAFDYVKFVDEGFAAQTKYANKAGDAYSPEELRRIDELVKIGGPQTFAHFYNANEFRYRKIIEHFGHLLEESVEARVYVPRRSWKNQERSYLDDPTLRREFVAELFDILLFHRAILAYAGVSGEEFAQVAAEKMGYNATRPDHNVNGDQPVVDDPAAELQGECPSSEFGFNTVQHHPV
jgi:hypothetical protein